MCAVYLRGPIPLVIHSAQLPRQKQEDWDITHCLLMNTEEGGDIAFRLVYSLRILAVVTSSPPLLHLLATWGGIASVARRNATVSIVGVDL